MGLHPLHLVVWAEETQPRGLRALWQGWWWPQGGLTPRGPCRDGCRRCCPPRGEPLLPHASTGEPPPWQVGLAPSPVGSPLLSPGSWCTQVLFVPRVEPLFPPVLRKSCSQSPLTFKVTFSGDPLFFCQIPSWKAWHEVQNLHNSGRTSLVLLFSR